GLLELPGRRGTVFVPRKIGQHLAVFDVIVDSVSHFARQARRQNAKQVTQLVIGEKDIGNLRQRERPSVPASALRLHIAELQELGVMDVVANRLSERRTVLRKHTLGAEALQYPVPLKKQHFVECARVWSDLAPGSVPRIEQNKLVEVQ